MRGSLTDSLGMAVALIVFVVIGYSAMLLWTTFSTQYEIQVNATNDTHPGFSASEAAIKVGGDNAIGGQLTAIPFVFLGLGIAALVGAYFVPSSPIFLPFGILMLGIFVFISAQFSNMLNEFMNVSEFAGINANYPLIGQIVTKLPLIVAVIGTLILILMHSRGSSTEGQV